MYLKGSWKILVVKMLSLLLYIQNIFLTECVNKVCWLILVAKLLQHFFSPPHVCMQPPGNSFQIVVATDGTQSFAIILFGEVNFAPTSASYTTSITTGASIATHWTAVYSNNITQAPFMMQHSYTPGVYVLDLIDFSSPQMTPSSCEGILVTAACNALRLRGSVPPECTPTRTVCVPWQLHLILFMYLYFALVSDSYNRKISM